MQDTTTSNAPSIDITAVRARFPVLHQQVNGYPLVYFDNAATTQKPQQVIDALTRYYNDYNANIHRGIHTLAEHATADFEATRKAVQAFIHAREAEEIIFTSGTTGGINLVAQTYGRTFLKKGDEVIISTMEHHSNIVPWQLVCEQTGAVLKVIPITTSGELILDEYKKLLSDKTRLVSVVYASNALGTVNPVNTVIRLAHEAGAKVLIDAAQAVVHCPVDVQEMDCDFLVFSGHKLYGPTGMGILYGKRELLEAMPPYQGGGEMISEVTFARTTFNELPYKFEAGTPNIGDVIAMKRALEFVSNLGKPAIAAHEAQLLERITAGLQDIPGIRIIGTAPHKIGVVSFVVEGLHHFDLGMMLDAKGIAIRTGHHCTQPLMDFLGIEGTNRASFAVYNTPEEVDYFLDTVGQIVRKRKK
ncbi:cysteine desulfurase [Compostibacter hankyongensis]|uniref:Cysteine desulfurase n=1 Tax=Compostibacter hankyongensis TaxID=1007089 RepID=A0ABP8FKL7_9BACT